MVRDLNLLKIQAELLNGICYSKVLNKCHQSLSSFFSKDRELVYFIDVEGLMQELGCTHNPEEWRLLVHMSKFS